MTFRILKLLSYPLVLLFLYGCVKDSQIHKYTLEEAIYSVANLKTDYETFTKDLDHYNDFYNKVNWDRFEFEKRNDTLIYIFKLYEGENVGSGSTFSAHIYNNTYSNGFLSLYPSQKYRHLITLQSSIVEKVGAMTGIGVCDDCHWGGGTIGIPPVPINPPTSPPPFIIPIPPSPGGPPVNINAQMLNPRDDCEHARNMRYDNNLIAQLLWLRDHAADPNKRTEKGFTYNINYTTGLYSSMSSAFEGLPNAPFADFNLSSPIDGLAHTHYSGLFPIFSPADITAMAAIYNAGYMSKPAAFSSILLTNAGTTYMLKIENVDMFKNWASSIKGNDKLFETIAQSYPLGPQQSISTNEKSINQLLQQNKTGIRLYRGNKGANDWGRLGLDKNNNVAIDPCNK